MLQPGAILESTIDGATRIIEWMFLKFGASRSLLEQSPISSFMDLPTSITHIPQHQQQSIEPTVDGTTQVLQPRDVKYFLQPTH